MLVTIPGNWDLSISIGSDLSSGKNFILWIRIVFPEKVFSSFIKLQTKKNKYKYYCVEKIVYLYKGQLQSQQK